MKRSIRKPVRKDAHATKSVSARIPAALLERVQKVRRKAERQGRTFNMSSIITHAQACSVGEVHDVESWLPLEVHIEEPEVKSTLRTVPTAPSPPEP